MKYSDGSVDWVSISTSKLAPRRDGGGVSISVIVVSILYATDSDTFSTIFNLLFKAISCGSGSSNFRSTPKVFLKASIPIFTIE